MRNIWGSSATQGLSGGVLSIRVACYIGDPNRDPHYEKYLYEKLAKIHNRAQQAYKSCYDCT